MLPVTPATILASIAVIGVLLLGYILSMVLLDKWESDILRNAGWVEVRPDAWKNKKYLGTFTKDRALEKERIVKR